jgi:hypothetical protein
LIVLRLLRYPARALFCVTSIDTTVGPFFVEVREIGKLRCPHGRARANATEQAKDRCGDDAGADDTRMNM